MISDSRSVSKAFIYSEATLYMTNDVQYFNKIDMNIYLPDDKYFIN